MASRPPNKEGAKGDARKNSEALARLMAEPVNVPIVPGVSRRHAIDRGEIPPADFLGILEDRVEALIGRQRPILSSAWGAPVGLLSGGAMQKALDAATGTPNADPHVTPETPGKVSEEGTDMADVTREEIDAKLAAAEARTETRFVQLDGKIDRLVDVVGGLKAVVDASSKEVREEGRATRSTMWVVGIGSVLAVMGIVIGLVALQATYQGNLIAAFSAAIAAKEAK